MKKTLLLASLIGISASAYAGWGTGIDEPTAMFPTGTNSYATDVVATSDGGVWTMVYHPNLRNAESEYDTSHVVYEYRIQYFDAEGNPRFPEEGLLVSDYANWSYTVVNQYMGVDNDGNLILSVIDCRNSADNRRSYTAYKISPDGTFLWGGDGVAVSDPMEPSQFAATMKFVTLEDNSTVFAWSQFGDGETQRIHMQRLSADGKQQWPKDMVADTKEETSYPYLVNSGDNTFIMVYAKTPSMVLYARKMDFDGESVWGSDVRIYRGGWGSIPMHTLVDVKPSNNGGVLVAWCDDRANTQIEWAYLSYVTPDGKLGFAGASDEADCKLSYADVRKFNVAVVAAEDASCFYAVWRVTSGSQTYQGMQMQKITLEGECLWGDEGKELYPFTDEASLGYVSLCEADDNGACAFFQTYHSYYDQRCLAARFDASGEFVWPDSYVYLSRPGRKSAGLMSQPYGKDGSWLVDWSDGGTSADDKDETFLMMVLNEDGTLGADDSGVSEVAADVAWTLCFDGRALCAPVADGTTATLYDAAGIRVASAVFAGGKAPVALPGGLYVAKVGEKSVKFAL